MCRLFLITAVFVSIILPCFSQGILNVITDKTTYAYGDSIIVTTSIYNNTDTTFSLFGSSSCLTMIKLDEMTFDIICSADEHEFIFEPGYSWSWKWYLDPYRMGIPNKNGVQKIYGFSKYHLDSTTFEAPIFYGGQILVGFNINIPVAEIQNIRDSLNAEVLYSHTNEAQGTISERWQILGILIDSVMSKYANDPRLNYLAPDLMLYSYLVYPNHVFARHYSNSEYALYSNYPNPFNSNTKIKFQLTKPEHVRLVIYNNSGQLIRILLNSFKPAGMHEIVFVPKDMASGVYYYSIIAGDFSQTKKMIYLK